MQREKDSGDTQQPQASIEAEQILHEINALGVAVRRLQSVRLYGTRDYDCTLTIGGQERAKGIATDIERSRIRMLAVVS